MKRVALVMGATQGLGRGAVEALAPNHAIAICARSENSVAKVVAELRADGVDAEGLAVDVTDPAGLERLFAHTAAELGKISVLVTNAGGPPPGSVLELTDEDWELGFSLTLMSVVRAVRLGVSHMRETGYGRIVMIGVVERQTTHFWPRPLQHLPSSGDGGDEIAGPRTRSGTDNREHGVPRALRHGPGTQARHHCSRKRGVTTAEERERSQSNIPMGRYGTPSEFGSLVAFLASPEAGYITGQSILIDGGLIRSLQ